MERDIRTQGVGVVGNGVEVELGVAKRKGSLRRCINFDSDWVDCEGRKTLEHRSVDVMY